MSSKTAQIAETEVYAGQKMVKLGDVVYEGDLLVSGVVESADGKTTYHHASAKILAQTNFTKEFSVALNQEEKNYTGKEKKRYRIDICGKKLPLFIATSISAPHDSKKEMDTQMCIRDRKKRYAGCLFRLWEYLKSSKSESSIQGITSPSTTAV